MKKKQPAKKDRGKHNRERKIQNQRTYHETKLKNSTLIQRNWPNASNNADIYMKYP